jgi:MtN3 and saliva related transmembrane protein
MDLVTLIGLVAAACTTGATLPQTIKVVKSKSTKDLSLITYLMVMVGGMLWLTYGVLIENQVIMFANSIAILLNLTVLGYKLKYK